LDPCTLGRPFHLLEDFQRRLAQHVGRLLEHRFNQRSDAQLRASAGGISAFMPAIDGGAWRSYRDGVGSLALNIERPLLLALLAHHYGDPGGADAMLQAPETETELRFAGTLHQQLLEALIACGAGGGHAFAVQPGALPRTGHRVLRIEVSDDALGVRGRIGLAFDEAWMAHLFDSAVPARAPAPPPAELAVPLRERLPVRINARIASLELPFDQVLRLAPGDILPIRPAGTAEVLVDDVRLYRARVAEQGGLLCLTFFEPAE